MKTRRARLAGIVILAASAALWIASQCAKLPLFADPQQLHDWVLGWDTYAPVVIIGLQVAQVLLAPIPGQGVGAASGYLFGACWGTVYSLIGTVVGSFIAITLARRFGRPLVERLISRKALARLDAGASQRGLLFFALIFLFPFLPDDAACFVAGLTTIPIPALMLAVLAGRAPGVFISAWAGANAANLGTGQLIALIAAGAAVAALFLLFERQLQAGAMALVDRFSR